MKLKNRLILIKSYIVIKSWLNEINKARSLPIGTIRQRGAYNYKKTRPGVWIRVTDEEAEQQEKEGEKELTVDEKEIQKIKGAIKLIDDKIKEFDEEIKDKQSKGEDIKSIVNTKNIFLKGKAQLERELTGKEKILKPKESKEKEEIKQPEKRKRGRPKKEVFNPEKGMEVNKVSDIPIKPIKDEKQIAQKINEVTPETRSEVQAQLMGYDPEQQSALEELEQQKYKYEVGELTPEQAGIPNMKSLGYFEKAISDYTNVIPKNIQYFNEKTILEKEKPSYIPDYSDEDVYREGGRIIAVKLGVNKYLLKSSKKVNGQTKQYLHLVSLDVLAATQDYYTKKQKAIQVKKDIDRLNILRKLVPVLEGKGGTSEQQTKAALLMSHITDKKIFLDAINEKDDKKAISKLKKIGKRFFDKPVKAIAINRATYSHLRFISDVTGDSKEKWKNFNETMKDLHQKSSDMQITYKDMESSFYKGRETSYGKKGLKDTIFKSHGVLVKRQNGDEITPEETKMVAKSIDSLYSIFGNKSQMAVKHGLRISHSGEVLMHARDATGIYFPQYHTIGVSAKFGEKDFGFALSHEWAHFMDHYKAIVEQKHHFSSHETGSDSGNIASIFRENMRKIQENDYQNNTQECFARAFEQYFMIKTGNEESIKFISNEKIKLLPKETQDFLAVHDTGNYVELEKFKTQIMPLIDKWLKDNEEVLKSIHNDTRLWVYK